MAKILVVEDDPLLRDMVRKWLTSDNHEVELSPDGRDAQLRLRQYSYDLLVLDIDLPFVSGLTLCQDLRASGDATLILMLTQKDLLSDKVEGFERGADDYLTKPFELQELSVRIKALLKRGRQKPDNTIELGGIRLNKNTFEVFVRNTPIELAEKEFALLEFLMRHAGQVFTLDALLNRVWTSDSAGSVEGVRVCITRLRKKLDLQTQESYIKNLHGIGYRFQVPSAHVGDD